MVGKCVAEYQYSKSSYVKFEERGFEEVGCSDQESDRQAVVRCYNGNILIFNLGSQQNTIVANIVSFWYLSRKP